MDTINDSVVSAELLSDEEKTVLSVAEDTVVNCSTVVSGVSSVNGTSVDDSVVWDVIILEVDDLRLVTGVVNSKVLDVSVDTDEVTDVSVDVAEDVWAVSVRPLVTEVFTVVSTEDGKAVVHSLHSMHSLLTSSYMKPLLQIQEASGTLKLSELKSILGHRLPNSTAKVFSNFVLKNILKTFWIAAPQD